MIKVFLFFFGTPASIFVPATSDILKCKVINVAGGYPCAQLLFQKPFIRLNCVFLFNTQHNNYKIAKFTFIVRILHEKVGLAQNKYLSKN